jgi:hypothetical protein
VEEVIAGNIIEHSAANFGTTINSEEGTIRFIFSDEIESGLVSADGEFARIKASINETENIGFSPVELIEGEFIDANLNVMIVTFSNGGINVKAIEPTQEPTGDFTRPVVEIKTNAMTCTRFAGHAVKLV